MGVVIEHVVKADVKDSNTSTKHVTMSRGDGQPTAS